MDGYLVSAVVESSLLTANDVSLSLLVTAIYGNDMSRVNVSSACKMLFTMRYCRNGRIISWIDQWTGSQEMCVLFPNQPLI